MRKIGLFLAVLAAAAMPAVAEAAKKGKKRVARPAAQTAKPIDTNEASARLVRGSLPIFLPTWALPVYFSTPMGQQDHPKQNPHLLNPQGSQPQQPAQKSRRGKQAKR
jgi:hypothetical protein